MQNCCTSSTQSGVHCTLTSDKSWIGNIVLADCALLVNPATMSTIQEIEAAIPKLSIAELEELRVWFEDYLEDHLELTGEVMAKLDDSRREIAAGKYTSRQPN